MALSTPPSLESTSVSSEVPVDNAGMVLTACFLPNLFDMNALLTNSAFKSSEAQTVARQLLNYISYSQNPVPSPHPLTNILCGTDSMLPLTTEEPLEPEAVQSADDMLQALIDHWDIGNTSVDGLRTAFISRAGTLQKLENEWRLTVEHEAFDMLLDRLPWSISVVKLRWMKGPVYVKWRE
ncbi:MAG: contractile injection system tape measure protein [Pseudomonadota bacterium]